MPRPRHPQSERVLDLRAADKTYDEISAVTGVSYHSVDSIIKRARYNGDPRAACITPAQRARRTGGNIVHITSEHRAKAIEGVRAFWAAKNGISPEQREDYRLLRRKRFSRDEALAILNSHQIPAAGVAAANPETLS
ncbi:hypothetical protein RADP37_05455 (plasmid) [Roseomonas mucosa]|uniref:Uncharacterized protein n=1 Tax=Roseomonas mucosa TaxID=207340 RepID=A0A4Y1MRT5_9PROT|nr:sigma-70 family RNA polymerase sigma factor [Roseomonas mucosa]AWV20339.1 hypothetical protein RADP37_05455 [Roseomonas mucosa]